MIFQKKKILVVVVFGLYIPEEETKSYITEVRGISGMFSSMCECWWMDKSWTMFSPDLFHFFFHPPLLFPSFLSFFFLFLMIESSGTRILCDS